ncbi:MAG: GyrI-like domain-containing protein [Pseudomonadota bacterium]
MISAPLIVQTSVQEAAVIRLKVLRSDMMKLFGPAVGELLSELHAQNIEPIGGVFAHHYRITSDTFDFDLGIKVSAPVKESGRVKRGELPAAKVVRTIYSGAYDGLPGAWDEVNAWIKINGLDQAGDLWELYSVGPQSSPNPADWRTELNRPLRA